MTSSCFLKGGFEAQLWERWSLPSCLKLIPPNPQLIHELANGQNKNTAISLSYHNLLYLSWCKMTLHLIELYHLYHDHYPVSTPTLLVYLPMHSRQLVVWNLDCDQICKTCNYLSFYGAHTVVMNGKLWTLDMGIKTVFAGKHVYFCW